ncbi:arginine--tRNA ligase [Elioraea sp. Yellowstone]|jgi:arginyl-tRNA synthetase|uniref:arginine--tRNA ligase n=1 Tax=Elioraea sp. Yellowstone TaxID=2592070 RepID=UPI00115182BE|nr:arginine--tRNA ligase [Elioraea sp. Yellowstone]TQF76319.1 arginine--tRNA ligase [Elioraea sp. Yellowstone]
MNIFHAFRDAIAAALPEAPPDGFTVEPPRDPAHGDISTNAALVLAKPLRTSPRALAERLAGSLRAHPAVAAASVAGPGFVNLTLRPEFLRDRLADILAAGTDYGNSTMGRGVRVNVEYVSANPTGPLHIGHCRGAVVGDALAALLAKAGYDVTREYYINDAGAQVDALAWAAYWRYLQALGTALTEAEFDALVPGGLQYRGDYLVPVGEALARRHGTALAGPNATPADPAHWLERVRDETVAAMMDLIRADLAALGVRQEVFTSEAALVRSRAVERVLAELEARDLIHIGVLEPPKGQKPDDWEPRPQTLFRASRFGDDTDRPLRKSDGSNTYFANDIAYHADKIARGFTRLIDVWGADHGGYVKRMQAAVQAVGQGRASLEIVLCQIVHLMKGGEPMRMSKRAGTFVTLRDLIDEVGRDVVRFIMLTRRADAQMEFDLDKVRLETKDNPVFYVQYAHARCRSVLRHAAEAFGAEAVAPAALAAAPRDTLADPAELALIRALVQWPRVVEQAAQAAEPHRIAFALYDVAAAFHALWNKGREEAELRFIRADAPAATMARLALVAATATVIASGLAVMGVEPVEEMR